MIKFIKDHGDGLEQWELKDGSFLLREYNGTWYMNTVGMLTKVLNTVRNEDLEKTRLDELP